jgi:antitoxin component of MazEF toxin-antitoxin module
MRIVKVRRVGNSNVVTLPKSVESAGFAAGASVVIEALPSGEVMLVPESLLRERIRAIDRKVIAEDREALDLQEVYDRGEAVLDNGRLRMGGVDEQ